MSHTILSYSYKRVVYFLYRHFLMDKFVYHRLSSNTYYYVKNGKQVFNMTEHEEFKLQKWELTNCVNNERLSTEYKQWAKVNDVPYYNSYEWDTLTVHTECLDIRFKKEDVTLPTEYIREGLFKNIIHHIHPFPSSEMKTTMTEYDLDMITATAGLYEIHGLGLNEPPKENKYFQFLRSGGAYLQIYEDQLHSMMQELYTHLEEWLRKDKIATQGLNWLTMPHIQSIHQEQVAHCLKWMREVFFK